MTPAQRQAYIFAMATSVKIRTPFPTPDEVADSFGMSQERREFLRNLAESVKTTKPKQAIPRKKTPVRRKTA
jgi:hypothetical protein